jgi:ankyrin repeat protein
LDIQTSQQKYSYLLHYAGLNKEIDVKQSVPQLPLMHAILTQDCDQVQILIALGANVNSRSNRHTAGSLSTAIRAYHDVSRNKADKAKAYAIFKYLLTKGVNPNNSTEIETPLQAAATRDSTLPLLQDLLRLPNINLQTQNIYGHSVFDCLQREINQKVINFNYTDGHRKVYTLLKNKIKKDESKT